MGVGLFALTTGFASTPASAQPRFTHAQHAQHAAAADVACNDCHKLSKRDAWRQKQPVGRRGGVHSPCSNSGCHARAFLTARGGGPPLCRTCHVDKPSGPLHFPPYRERGASDFVLGTFDHTKHTEGPFCQECHKPAGKRGRKTPAAAADHRGPGHSSCAAATCHGGQTEPSMSNCQGCHVPSAGNVAVLASRERDLFRVDKAFSHRGHRRVSPDDRCQTCHTNVAMEAGARVPLPMMIACETCHEGHKAFSALGTDCRRCHVR